ncbi:MAG TPA: FAD-dependent oxidoreductase [Acidiferrobacter sp.]|nr:FAD-dependent oxidoreductase [Acidiferrobacter sp.]
MIRLDNERDVIIVGAGAVGSALCYALALRGLTVAMVDAQPAHTEPSVRTSALTNASCQWLSTLGLWPHGDLKVAPMSGLQILNGNGRGRLRFDSADLGLENLGVIVDHAAFETLLRSRARTAPGAQWHNEAARHVSLHHAHTEVVLASGRSLRAPLLIAADGAHSIVRDQLGVSVWRHDYGQTAICANIQLGCSHDGVAWQRFLATGPLALLPLPDPTQSSLIWSTANLEAEQLRELSERDFNDTLTQAFGADLGTLQILSPRAYFPLMAAHAEQYVGSRFALIGDAAHRVHPLAGQGVNLGFADAQTLVQTLLDGRAKGTDLGSRRLLRQYERSRKGANLGMLLATDVLNRAFRHRSPWSEELLTMGLNITQTLNPLKAFFMNQAGAQPQHQ